MLSASKQRPWSVVAALGVVLAVSALLAAPASASERHPTLAELEGEVICPTCHTTLDQSDAPVARRIESYIRTRIAAGDTKSEIKACWSRSSALRSWPR